MEDPNPAVSPPMEAEKQAPHLAEQASAPAPRPTEEGTLEASPPDSGLAPEPRSARRRPLVLRVLLAESLHGAILLAGLLVVFFWTPLSKLESHYYSSADFLNEYTLLEVDPEHRPQNQLISDPAAQMQAWLMFNRDELHEGRIPLWNPYNLSLIHI